MAVEIGDIAPDFTLLSDEDKLVSLQSLRGKKVVLYFYPKDNTPGCTKESCDFRNIAPSFAEKNSVILGISKDNPARHRNFKQKYQLPFTLLADESGDTCEAYGVINKKSLFGKTFLGIQRSTFLINEQGVIEQIWRKVKVPGHAEHVLDEIR